MVTPIIRLQSNPSAANIRAMQRLLILFLLGFFAQIGKGQNKVSLELSTYSRYDQHADYTSRYGDRSYTNAMQLWGLSYGLSMSCLLPINQWFKLKAGAAYYQLGIDKVRSSSPWGEDIPTRTIDYNHPTGIQPLFNTDQYHYNNLVGSLGLSYEHPLNEKIALNLGLDYNYYYTFSQRYQITYDNAVFKTQNTRPLGFGVSTYAGLLKQIKQNYYANSGLLIPIYQQLKGDRTFREEDSLTLHKWFKGIGLFITVGKYF